MACIRLLENNVYRRQRDLLRYSGPREQEARTGEGKGRRPRPVDLAFG